VKDTAGKYICQYKYMGFYMGIIAHNVEVSCGRIELQIERKIKSNKANSACAKSSEAD